MNHLEYTLDRPTYPTAMAARLSGLSSGQVGRWLKGYTYKLSKKNGEITERHQKPLVVRKGAVNSAYASFLDLIDLLFIREFLKKGLSIQMLRKALAEATETIGGHHFAQSVFFTNGKKIFLQIKNTKGKENLLELSSGGQWVIAPIIEQLAERIDFDNVSGYAQKWYPMENSKEIVIDPLVAFGKPTLTGKRITTENIYDLYVGEDGNVEPVAKWLNLKIREVKIAIKFEDVFARAA